MSYILDALRRADAERERGDVPHLHTQAVPAGEMDAEDASTARPWMWLAAGLAIALLGTLAWVISSRSPGQEATSPVGTVSPQPAAVPEPVPTQPASAVQAEPDAPTPAPAVAPPSIVPRSLVPAPSPVAPRATTAPSLPPAVAEPRARASASPTAAATTAPTAGTPREAAITQLAELPEDVRRELPRLTIGGSMYSEKPASRMLIVNGHLLREGDKVSPTVTLEQIRLRSAVLTYKTYRYEIGF